MNRINELTKRFSVFQQGTPLQPELELKREIEHRTLLLIKARWIVILLGAVYGVVALALYHYGGSLGVIKPAFVPLSVSFAILTAYNAWYQYSYKWFTHLKLLNHAQIIFDIVFATILIYYTGGINSWLWVIYPLLIVEAAVSLNTKRDTWMIAVLCTLAYGILFSFEYRQIIPGIKMPFAIQINPADRLIHGGLFLGWMALNNFYFAFIGNHLIGVIKANDEHLKKEIIKDGLTGLYNRSYFFYRLTSEIARCKRYGRIVSVLMIDLDHFKKFNDTFGHLEGDILLQRIADILKTSIRRGNYEPTYDIDVPCRYGGDEFAIILPETAAPGSQKVAERLRETVTSLGVVSLAERIRRSVEDMKLGVTISVGAATYPDHGQSPEQVMRAADAALYKAKKTGNAVVNAILDKNPA